MNVEKTANQGGCNPLGHIPLILSMENTEDKEYLPERNTFQEPRYGRERDNQRENVAKYNQSK